MKWHMQLVQKLLFLTFDTDVFVCSYLDIVQLCCKL